MTSSPGRSGGRPSDRLRLPPEPASVRTARRFVSERCTAAGLSRQSRDDALLITSELVTNAVLHGRSEVCLEVEASTALLRVSVLDENSRHPVAVVEDPDALDGRGLALVSALAVRWGVQERALGKAVWFEVVDR